MYYENGKAEHLLKRIKLKVCPEKLPDAVLDENVHVHLVRQYFSRGAWLLVEDAVCQKATYPYVCNVCFHNLQKDADQESIACDHCLCWFHLNCKGLKKGTKDKVLVR